ncbi:MAG TPA: hypothetical protein VGF86_06410 [Candidatus Tumulicola sp.]|jgi:tetratricopeptide (TPR) repeat protein
MAQLKDLFDRDPDAVAALFSNAEKRVSQKRLKEAYVILERFATEFPEFDSGMVWYELADIFESQGDLLHAEHAYREALKYQPKYDVFLIAFGFFLWRIKRDQEAVEVLLRVQELRNLEPGLAERIQKALIAISEGQAYDERAEEIWKW